ncbi:bifunctional phosphopantothenoylcysteine decarboxylase/phosphopantothenate--cysteine ligase CoaBC [Acetobacter oeni]|uniref:Coenzyme A biosynthesis bifunctional protein CoaBC n=1 Tax=Acetobacter oeni TaxID=304077 RepID=A0A511XNC7_9PROT|nr:bifunctional phosphopantothenoylcysteine decarboxylase/phosphopantothenate--cysteine ligase CoaBC [Acetobacter oeni]MBB3883279.1 phosphopantothenoylcysteine decarboxylase/phosphopantothenate--cysteine ligase [Acetobacter oeni]NHO19344.1 bifunctional phosphopantothenoylcysteine decarboxylase/phosphopantothenate--cysteine ligase CoaBC [Acetobacter oeni]GBR10154.1 phosphopantothenoylcysteine synthase [Acetobacter oeni LMG 21952]GEN64450.1 phosphopantothenate synthase [Acetobacter oeni]
MTWTAGNSDDAFPGTAAKRVLLIVSGGIAAYKALELVRLLKAACIDVRCVLTKAGAQFVTPLSLQVLSGEPVGEDLFSLTDEQEMGHIALSRSADLVVVAPATANILAKMAHGLADDLATTLLLATDTPVMVAPAMNVRMWEHPATRANMALLADRGVRVIGPDEGMMACGEFGPGRFVGPAELRDEILGWFGQDDALNPADFRSRGEAWEPLAGRTALVTAGPTHEPVDPVRYLGNRSSGLQGYAIASALAVLGARVTLVSGPVMLADPAGVDVVRVETGVEMERAVRTALPVDIAVCVAAVADWRIDGVSDRKIKKQAGAPPPVLTLVSNPDILAMLAAPGPERPALVVGFAAETNDVEAGAITKRARKGCDWIVANDVSTGTNVMGGQDNRVILITEDGPERWPLLAKTDLALRLAERIAAWFGTPVMATGGDRV